MIVKLLKTIIIKNLPGNIVKKLRYQRILIEKAYYLLYCAGIKKSKLHPYYLKYSAKSGIKRRATNSDDIFHRWGEAFCDYNSKPNKKKIKLMWADGPAPGNYGDWLSPYIITKLCDVNAIHLSEAGNHKEKHLIALGSIISLANENSIIIGAGIPSKGDHINTKAKTLSVRGPYTAQRLHDLGGDHIKSFGDIGFLLRRIYSPKITNKKKSILIVRHIQHTNTKITLKEGFREISIYRAKPEDIESFIDELHTATFVATSAMHCFITCISYNIPCILFSLGDWKDQVPGDGTKYKDALAGVGLREITPLHISNPENFCQTVLEAHKYIENVSDEKLDEIEESIHAAIKLL